MQKILVALDGSESCQKATETAKELALLCKSKVTFITVVPRKSITSFSESGIKMKLDEREQEKNEAKEMLKQCDEIYNECEVFFKGQDITVNKVIEESNAPPSKKIYEYAEENDFDLIILADKGRSKVKKFLLGSTAEKVVRHSEVSVLVAK